MEQRDYILREIEKIGKLLMGIMGKLKNLNEAGQYHYGLTLADQEFEEETGLTLSVFARMELDSMKAFLHDHPGLMGPNLELFADLMVEIADFKISDPPLFYKRALDLLQMAEEEDKTFSMERAAKIEYVKGKLANKE